MFNARLLFRLESFIPAALATRPRLTWREVVSGMLRMSFVTETTLSYFKAARIQWGQEDFERIQLVANTAINDRQTDWHERFVETLADVSGSDVAAVNEAIQLNSSFVDSLKYVQLGNPEHIAIVREDATTLLARKGIAATSDQGERG